MRASIPTDCNDESVTWKMNPLVAVAVDCSRCPVFRRWGASWRKKRGDWCEREGSSFPFSLSSNLWVSTSYLIIIIVYRHIFIFNCSFLAYGIAWASWPTWVAWVTLVTRYTIIIIYEVPTNLWHCPADQKARRLWTQDCLSRLRTFFFFSSSIFRPRSGQSQSHWDDLWRFWCCQLPSWTYP